VTCKALVFLTCQKDVTLNPTERFLYMLLNYLRHHLNHFVLLFLLK